MMTGKARIKLKYCAVTTEQGYKVAFVGLFKKNRIK